MEMDQQLLERIALMEKQVREIHGMIVKHCEDKEVSFNVVFAALCSALAGLITEAVGDDHAAQDGLIGRAIVALEISMAENGHREMPDNFEMPDEFQHRDKSDLS